MRASRKQPNKFTGKLLCSHSVNTSVVDAATYRKVLNTALSQCLWNFKEKMKSIFSSHHNSGAT